MYDRKPEVWTLAITDNLVRVVTTVVRRDEIPTLVADLLSHLSPDDRTRVLRHLSSER